MKKSANDSFDGLWKGANAILSRAEARLDVAFWLGRHPIRFNPTVEAEEGLAEAVEAVRSYHAVRHIIEVGEPSTYRVSTDEVRTLLAPVRKSKNKSTKPRITPNKLWSKTSY